MMKAGALAGEEADYEDNPTDDEDNDIACVGMDRDCQVSEADLSYSQASCSFSQQEALEYAQALYDATTSLLPPNENATVSDEYLATEYAPSLQPAARAKWLWFCCCFNT